MSNLDVENIKGIICLEGLIASGKSTLGKYLADNIASAKYFPEYVNTVLLDYYVNDMQNNAFSFQLIMLHQRFNIYRLAMQHVYQGGLAIVDRSFCGDYAFALMQKDKGFINEKQWQIYLNIVIEQQQMLNSEYPNYLIPQFILFLECNIDLCLQRIILRNRSAENTYTKRYLENLQTTYEKTLQLSKCPVQKINNETEITNTKLAKIISLIKENLEH